MTGDPASEAFDLMDPRTEGLWALVVGSHPRFTWTLLDYLDFGEARLVGYLLDLHHWRRPGSVAAPSVPFEDDREHCPILPVISDGVEFEVPHNDMVRPCTRKPPIIGEEGFFKYLIERLMFFTPDRRNHVIRSRLFDVHARRLDTEEAVASKEENGDADASDPVPGTFRQRFFSSEVFDSYCHQCRTQLSLMRKTQIMDRIFYKLRSRIRAFLFERTALREGLISQGTRAVRVEDMVTADRIFNERANVIIGDDRVGPERFKAPPTGHERIHEILQGASPDLIATLPLRLRRILQRRANTPRISLPLCASCVFSEFNDSSRPMEAVPSVSSLVGKDNLSKLTWRRIIRDRPPPASMEETGEANVPADQQNEEIPGSEKIEKFDRVASLDLLPMRIQDYLELATEDRAFTIAMTLPLLRRNGLIPLAQITSIRDDSGELDPLAYLLKTGPERDSIQDENNPLAADPILNPYKIAFRSAKIHGGLAYNPLGLVALIQTYSAAREALHDSLRGKLSVILSQYLGPTFILDNASQILLHASRTEYYTAPMGGNRLLNSAALHLANDFDLIRTGTSPLLPSDHLEQDEVLGLVKGITGGGAVTLSPSEIRSPVIRRVPMFEVFRSIRRVIDILSRVKTIDDHPAWASLNNMLMRYLRVFVVVDEHSLARDYLTLVEEGLRLNDVVEPHTGEFIDKYLERRTVNNINDNEAMEEKTKNAGLTEAEIRAFTYSHDQQDLERIDSLFRHYVRRRPVTVKGTEQDFLDAMDKMVEREFELQNRETPLFLAREAGEDITGFTGRK